MRSPSTQSGYAMGVPTFQRWTKPHALRVRLNVGKTVDPTGD
jgi:hypothetical protein